MTNISLPDLVARAFEAACDLDGLGEWIRNLADYFGDSGAALIIWPHNDEASLNFVTHGVSADTLQERFEQPHESGGLFAQLNTLSDGEFRVIEDALSATDLPLDGPLVRPNMRAIAGVVLNDDVHRCFLTLFRDAGRDEFTQSEIDSLQTLVGYFRRAVILNRRFIDLVTQQKTMLLMLDNAPRGIVSLGQNGQVTFLNAEAKRIFALADGLSLADRVINFRDGKLRHKFYEFIEKARQRNEASTNTSMMLNATVKKNSRPRFQIMAYTLPVKKSQAELNPDEALVVLMIQDPSTSLPLRVELLQTFYELSAAEARLAVELWRGNSLPDAAELLHISVNTARSQLRGIFKKVGVSSQATLLQELAAGAKDVTRETRDAQSN